MDIPTIAHELALADNATDQSEKNLNNPVLLQQRTTAREISWCIALRKIQEAGYTVMAVGR